MRRKLITLSRILPCFWLYTAAIRPSHQLGSGIVHVSPQLVPFGMRVSHNREYSRYVRLVKGRWPDRSGQDRDIKTGFVEAVDGLSGWARHVALASHDVNVALEANESAMPVKYLV